MNVASVWEEPRQATRLECSSEVQGSPACATLMAQHFETNATKKYALLELNAHSHWIAVGEKGRSQLPNFQRCSQLQCCKRRS